MKRPGKRLVMELKSWLFVLPHLSLFLIFILIPLLINGGISFYNWSLLGNKAFIGLGNFEELSKIRDSG